MTNSHLIIPDCHVLKGFNPKIFTKLGELITETKPKHVICLGDFADMASLNSHEGFQGALYKEDIQAVNKALGFLWKPLKRAKKKLPKFWMLEGNHEFRIKRVLKDYPILKDTISIYDLLYKEHKFEYIEYEGKEPGILDLDGISYAHFFTHANSPNAISGKYHASALIQKLHKSATCGHSHMRHFHSEVDGQGKRLNGLVAGCLFQEFKGFAGQGNRSWWKGLTLKHDVCNGSYDPEFISLERLLK